VAILVYFSGFNMLFQDKSGNPGGERHFFKRSLKIEFALNGKSCLSLRARISEPILKTKLCSWLAKLACLCAF
jgi:hypothetical protein